MSKKHLEPMVDDPLDDAPPKMRANFGVFETVECETYGPADDLCHRRDTWAQCPCGRSFPSPLFRNVRDTGYSPAVPCPNCKKRALNLVRAWVRPTWTRDGKDHYRTEVHDRYTLATWRRVDGSWVWEVWVLSEDSDEPAAKGEAEAYNEATMAAEDEALIRLAGSSGPNA